MSESPTNEQAKKNEGEGNRTADRKYREGVRRHVESGAPKPAGEEAQHALEGAEAALKEKADGIPQYGQGWTDDMFMATSVLARVGAATKDPKYGAASEWPPGAACSSTSHCQRLWNAIRQSTRSWPAEHYEVCLPRASRSVPGKSASTGIFRFLLGNVSAPDLFLSTSYGRAD